MRLDISHDHCVGQRKKCIHDIEIHKTMMGNLTSWKVNSMQLKPHNVQPEQPILLALVSDTTFYEANVQYKTLSASAKIA